ncbi:MAG: hypothetical protein HY909_11545 [Deltaproteobacteria bacterium]|nr:hypothetical protein [Deltaproteobacteria bacterium]
MKLWHGLTVCALLAAPFALEACGSFANSPSTDRPGGPPVDAGAPAAVRTCFLTSECLSNEICLHETGPANRGRCWVPDGRCGPEYPGGPVTGRCYSGSRCDTGTGGSEALCTFLPEVRQAFPEDGRRIQLDSPNERSELRATDGVSVRWDPTTGAVPGGATVIAVIMDALPQRNSATNRLTNWQHVRWIWSSAEPGAGSREGMVPLRAGRTGVTRDGRLNDARYGRDTLADGTWWWFVFAVVNGEVAASSDVVRFRVGLERDPQVPCRVDSDCSALFELPELGTCISERCARRCASDLDCAQLGTLRCDRMRIVPEARRHNGFCFFDRGGDGGVNP